MRAYKIKESYMKTNCFLDNGQFEVGKQVAYEMEMDFRAMKHAEKTIREYVNSEAKNFNHSRLLMAADFLKERIENFK